MANQLTGIVLFLFLLFNVLRSIEYCKQIKRHMNDDYLNLKSSVAGTFIAGAANAMNGYCALLRSKNGFNEIVFFIMLNAISCFVLFFIVWKAHKLKRAMGHPPIAEEPADGEI